MNLAPPFVSSSGASPFDLASKARICFCSAGAFAFVRPVRKDDIGDLGSAGPANERTAHTN